jgi:hypothetical protein
MRNGDQIRAECARKINAIPYQFVHYKKFDYNILKLIWAYRRPGKASKETFNDVIIMADTETSKKQPDECIGAGDKKSWKVQDNHVVIWTLSIRAYGHNIVTLWGRKPSAFCKTLLKIHSFMPGDKTFCYFHNFSYDYWFLRKFMFDLYGLPVKQLNVKPLYPIYIEFEEGIVFRDSLILSQRKLEKWAVDLQVDHLKETGKWDYDKIRNQNTPLTDDELSYAEHDTLAGVECLDKTFETLGKKVYTAPFTATGIPREQTVKRGGSKAHKEFLSMALTLIQYEKMTKLYHGGFVHGDRHFLDWLIDLLVRCYDFMSSYPYIMLAFKFPMEKFMPMDNCSKDEILEDMENTAYMFKFIATGIRLKSDEQPMPALQYSKCELAINAIQDNGRILCADYVEIYLSEYDLAVINEQYDMDRHICCEVEYAAKDYLPRWFTDYVWECFVAKTKLKGGDPVEYSIAKSKVNCLYGMCCQHSIQPEILEDYITGEFKPDPNAKPEEMYQKYLDRRSTVLPYQWGVWVTSIAFYNIHQLIKCCNDPFYSDTDSCYGSNWDEAKVAAYNEGCKQRILANGYGPVEHNGREYWIGTAESDDVDDVYTEFKYMGAKRYCGRRKADNKLKITVAGVPKKAGAKCLNDDIGNFKPGFIFDGLITNKKTHMYNNVDAIFTDENGNECGDSVDLIPCDYKLSKAGVEDWESVFFEEVNIQVYEEEQS